MKFALLLVLFIAASGCRKHVDDYFTAEQKKQDIALVELGRDTQSSRHYVWLKGAEKPHYHDRHVVNTSLLSGAARLHLGERVIDMKAGEELAIGAGELHWVENLDPDHSVLAATFSPPFDGMDRRFAKSHSQPRD